MPAIFPNPMIQYLGLSFLFLIIYFSTIYKKKYFTFFLIIYIFSHIQLGVNQGGAFNIIAFVALLLSWFRMKKDRNAPKNPHVINWLLFFLFLINFIGYFQNLEVGFLNKVIGFASLSGYILMFNFTSRIYLSKERLKIFLIVTILMLIWMALISLNMRLGVVLTQSTYFGIIDSYIGSSRVGSLFNFSASAEYAMLSFIMLFPFYLSKKQKDEVKISNVFFLVAFLSVFVLIILTQMRSNLILIISYFIIFYFFVLSRKKFNQPKYFLIILIVFLAFILFASFLKFGDFMDRLATVNINSLFDPKAVETGQGINRSYTMLIMLLRISEKSWLVGYGWSSIQGNQLAWFGPAFKELFDPHSLYLSLIPLFGWIGSVIFISIILYTLLRLIKALTEFVGQNTHHFTLLYSFIFIIIFFLINQYKATILSDSNYFMIFWIWLGLANGTVNTLKQKPAGIM